MLKYLNTQGNQIIKKNRQKKHQFLMINIELLKLQKNY